MLYVFPTCMPYIRYVELIWEDAKGMVHDHEPEHCARYHQRQAMLVRRAAR